MKTTLFLNLMQLISTVTAASPSPPPPIMPAAPPGFTCNNNCNNMGPSYTSDGICDDGGEGAEYNICGLGQDCMDCGVRYISPPPAPSFISSSPPSPSNSWPPLPFGPLPNAPPLPGLPPLPPDSQPSMTPSALEPSAAPPSALTPSAAPASLASNGMTPVVPPSSPPASDKNHLYWLIPVLGLFLILNAYLLFLCVRKYYNDSSD